jgi:creatinine amidohydrolase/Fe(II)-dependent formamide hydrolase-like protein
MRPPTVRLSNPHGPDRPVTATGRRGSVDGPPGLTTDSKGHSCRFGDPTLANAERGRALDQAVVDNLAELLGRVAALRD